MDKSTCPRCGGQIVASGNGRSHCKHCRFILPEEIANEELSLLYDANRQLRIGDFDGAEAFFRDIVERYPKSSEGYWGLVLARYGIKYEKDYDGSRVPTCYTMQYESIYDDADYRKAVSLADEETAAGYRSIAETIERVSLEWLRKASKEAPYDIFLSYKDTDFDGASKTEDYHRVYELYHHLTDLGYRVFFARVSLRDKAGEKSYEPYIFNALNTAKAMIVYASKPEYVSATWVKNEWMRFYRRMKDGKKRPNSLVVAYAGFNAALLPKPLDRIQNFDVNSLTFLVELDAYLGRLLSEDGNDSAKPEAAPTRYKLSVSSVNPSQGTAAIAVGQGHAGESVCVIAAPKEGFAFAGWFAGSEKVGVDATYFFEMPAKDVSLIALFQPKAEDDSHREIRGAKPILSSDGSTVEYGLYPQTRVGDPDLIAALDSIPSAERNGYYFRQGAYYAKANAKTYSGCMDFHDGTRIVQNTSYWFKCEPIRWKVLSTKNGTYHLLSEAILDAHCFNDDYEKKRDGFYANNYANSEIRSWLNDVFYRTAFAFDDSAILTTEVDNSPLTTGSKHNKFACENTQDKVFLPSYQDYLNRAYGFSGIIDDQPEPDRCAKPTDWALARGGSENNVSNSLEYYRHNGPYITRSPKKTSSTGVYYVDFDGRLYGGGVGVAHNGVRPAITIKID